MLAFNVFECSLVESDKYCSTRTSETKARGIAVCSIARDGNEVVDVTVWLGEYGLQFTDEAPLATTFNIGQLRMVDES